jgi:hypothetical protein
MPRKKKQPVEMTTDDAMKKLFPKKLREEANKTALDSRKKSTKKDSS